MAPAAAEPTTRSAPEVTSLLVMKVPAGSGSSLSSMATLLSVAAVLFCRTSPMRGFSAAELTAPKARSALVVVLPSLALLYALAQRGTVGEDG